MGGIRSTRSNKDPRVTILSLDEADRSLDSQSITTTTGLSKGSIPAPATPSKAPDEIKEEPDSPLRSISTSLEMSNEVFLPRTTRRSTRSTRSTINKPLADLPTIQNTNSIKDRKGIDLASYTYLDAPGPSTPPRKRIKREDPPTPLVALQDIKPPTPTPGSAKKKALPLLKLDKAHPEPKRWKEQYDLISHMRKGIIAPVDDMGCERPLTMMNMDPKTTRFHILISLMLSSQTKDTITSQAMTNLHQTLPSGLSAQSLSEAPREVVEGCINKVGFWRRKADYIQEAATRLLERPADGQGDVPDTLEELCDLRGVGPKMAFLALQCAWDINAGIGVDVHVHRITNRLKWHKPPTTNPEQTRLNLQSWLPSNLHKSINPLLVGFGQIICLPVGPRCDVCLLGQKSLCPSRVKVDPRGRKDVVYTFKDDFEDLGVKSEETSALESLEGAMGEHGGIEGRVEDGPLAKVEIGYENGPLVKLEPGVAYGVSPSD